MTSNVKAAAESTTIRLFALIEVNGYPHWIETKLVKLSGDRESLKEIIPKLLTKDLAEFQTEEQKHYEEVRQLTLESDEEGIGAWVSTMSEYELKGDYISSDSALFTYQIIEITDKL